MRKWEPKFGATLLKIELINLIVFLKIGPSQQSPWKKDENGDQFRPHFSFFSVMAHLRLKDSSALNIFFKRTKLGTFSWQTNGNE